jgi:hypothetical protein
MMILAQFLATLAIVLPAAPPARGVADVVGGGQDHWQASVDVSSQPVSVRLPGLAPAMPADTWNQVRIEQRLIIRITPRAPGRDELAIAPQPVTVRMRERKTAKCLPAGGIAGVKPMTDSRLMLFMRDRRLLGADLARACNARDFYLGFYVSQTPDGQICVGRDTIHSRAGTTCTIERLRELVPDD